MKLLDLSDLSIMDAKDLTEEDKRLVNALFNSSITQLDSLGLQRNNQWFIDDELREQLFDFIKRQTKLAKLNIVHNNLSMKTRDNFSAWMRENIPSCEIRL